MKIVGISGSTRKDSYNKKLLAESEKIARELGADVTIFDLKDAPIPLYDSDLESEKGLPENAKKLQTLFANADGIIIASPEYNGSISGTLKNAIDWLTRDSEGKPTRKAFEGKRFAIMSASPSQMGGSRSLEHLRYLLTSLRGNVLEEQVTLADAYNQFNGQNRLTNSEVKSQLEKEIKALLKK